MKVKLLCFAVLRDIVGSDSSELSLAGGTTAADVWQQLRSSHKGLERYTTPPMIAVNEEYVQADTQLQDGDVLAFIPPVSGG
jgi:molybdopterin synthase sulfur carrier subunit